jgi:hypothetical protein
MIESRSDFKSFTGEGVKVETSYDKENALWYSRRQRLFYQQ